MNATNHHSPDKLFWDSNPPTRLCWLFFLFVATLLFSAPLQAQQGGPDVGQGDPEAQDEANNDQPKGETDSEDEDADPVDMRDGSFGFRKQVLSVPGRGMDLDMTLSYRSSAEAIPTRTAPRWTHPYEQKIVVTIGNFPINDADWEGPIDVGHANPPETGDGGGEPSSSDLGSNFGPGGPYQIYAFHYHDLMIDRYHADGAFPTQTKWVGGPGSFVKMAGNFVDINKIKLPERMFVRHADGTLFEFGELKPHDPAERKQFTYRLSKIYDRNGNTITMSFEQYIIPNPIGWDNHVIRIKDITDTLGQVTQLQYDPSSNWLTKIIGPTGRTVDLEHTDGRGNLTAIVLPSISNSASRHEFEYTPVDTALPKSGYSITTVTAPNNIADGSNTPYITNEWSTSQRRVERQLFGGVNASGIPAGGFYDFLYEYQFTGSELDHTWFLEKHRVARIDPNGNVKMNIYDEDGRRRLLYRFTGRRAHTPDRSDMGVISDFITVEPSQWPPIAANNTMTANSPGTNAHMPGSEVYIERQNHNSDNLVIMEEGPDWRTDTYHDPSPDLFQRRNILYTRKYSNANPADSILTAYLYDPIYNQVRQIFDPRGTGQYTPENGGVASGDRYGQRFIFDYQEGSIGSVLSYQYGWEVDLVQQSAIDALAGIGLPVDSIQFSLGDSGGNQNGVTDPVNGNVVKTIRDCNAWDNLTAGTFKDVSTTVLSRYNSYGQEIESIDQDGVVDASFYFPETDPSGLGGSLPSAAGGGWLGKSVVASHLESTQTPLPEQAASSFQYDSLGRQTMITTPRGFSMQLEYNDQDQKTRQIDPDGNSIFLTYDAEGNVVRKRTEHRRPIPGSDGVAIGGSAGVQPDIVTQWIYDILGAQVERRDFVNDARGVLVTQRRYDRTGALALTLLPEFGNDPTAFIAGSLDELGRPWQTMEGGVTSQFRGLAAHADIPELLGLFVDHPDMALTEHKYAGACRVLTVNPSGHTATFEHDGYLRKSAMIDPLGHRMEFEHDIAGNNTVTRQVDVTGLVLSETIAQFDEFNRRFQVDKLFQLPNGNAGAEGPLTPGDGLVTVRFKFDAFGNLVESIGDNGHITTSIFDRRGRMISSLEPTGDSVDYGYDADSNPIYTATNRLDHDGTVLAPMRHWVFYDAMGRAVASTNESGHTTRSAYDSLGRVVFSSDANTLSASIPISTLDTFGDHHGLSALTKMVNDHGNTAWTEWDDAGKIVRTTRHMRVDGKGGNPILPGSDGTIVTQNAHDKMGRILARVDDSGNITRYAYDGKSNRTLTTFSDGTVNTWTYTPYNKVHVGTDASGSVTTHTYDALERLTRKDIVRGAGVEGATRERFLYDGQGRIKWADTATGALVTSVLTRSYDTLSNMTRETLNGVTTRQTYDGMNNHVFSRYANGQKWRRFFDPRGRLLSVRDVNASTVVANYGWLSLSVRKRAHSNNTTMWREYDKLVRPTRTRHENSNGEFVKRRSVWDRVANRKARVNELNGSSFLYFYDSMNRMVASQGTNSLSMPFDKNYELDGVGNRESVQENGITGLYVMDPSDPYPADFQMNQYTSTPDESRLYDEVGNLTNRQSTGSGGQSAQIAYDYRNLMVRYVDTTTGFEHKYEYDPLGRRTKALVESASGLKETRFFYTNGTFVSETQDGSGSTTAIYLWGARLDELILQDRDDDLDGNFERFFAHGDDQANINALTRADGSVVELYEYSDYGMPIDTDSFSPLGQASTIGNPILYNGLHFDQETQWLYSRSRYLDPKSGRWTTRDPLGLWGDLLNLGNAYTFVGNNPWSARDPFGTTKWSDIENGTTPLVKYMQVAGTVASGATKAFAKGGAKAVTKFGKSNLAGAMFWLGSEVVLQLADETGAYSQNPSISGKVAEFVHTEIAEAATKAIYEFNNLEDASGEAYKRGTDSHGYPYLENQLTGDAVAKVAEYVDYKGDSVSKYSFDYSGDVVEVTVTTAKDGSKSYDYIVSMEDGTTLQTGESPDGRKQITVRHTDTEGVYAYIFVDKDGNYTSTTMTTRQLNDLKKAQRKGRQRSKVKSENDRATDPKLRKGEDAALNSKGEPLSSKNASTDEDKAKLKGDTEHHGTAKD